MKNLSAATLALVVLAPAGANAKLFKNFKAGGSLDIQTTSARNVSDFATLAAPNETAVNQANGANNDRLGHANTRLIVKLDWDIFDYAHSRVTVAKGAGVAARTYGSGSQDLNAIQTATLVEEANVKIDKVLGRFDLTAGRQFYGEEGDLIVYFGPRGNYGMTVTALDAFRADWNGENISVTGIAGKTQDSGINTVQNDFTVPGARDLRGVVVSYRADETVKPSAYMYNRVVHNAGSIGSANGRNDNLWIFGAKAKLAAGGWTGSLELAKNLGENRPPGGAINPRASNYTGYAIQAKAGCKFDVDDLGLFNPWAEFGLGTGDANAESYGNNTFQSILTDYRPGGIYGRFDQGSTFVLGNFVDSSVGSNGLSNRVIWGFGVKDTPTAHGKLTVGAQFYRYAFQRLAPIASGQTRSRNIGSEFDLTGEWKHSENVSFKTTAGWFLPGAHAADVKGANAALNPAVMLAGDVSIKF